MNLGKLLLDAKAHIQFVLVVTVIVAVIFVVAVAAERVLFKDNIKSVAKDEKNCGCRYAVGDFGCFNAF